MLRAGVVIALSFTVVSKEHGSCSNPGVLWPQIQACYCPTVQPVSSMTIAMLRDVEGGEAER